MANDRLIGLLMAIVALAGILVELYLLLLPAVNTNLITGIPAAQYWALAIPVLLGVVGVLLIVAWIGYTMWQTPPPEAWDFDDLEDELELEDEEMDVEGTDTKETEDEEEKSEEEKSEEE